jgi:heterogeneous nuclear ribonucleoprotein A1/A3
MDTQTNEAVFDGEANDVKSSDLREEDDKSQPHSGDGASAG